MKKVLSLLLAMVMTMSLLTLSVGAETFTDSADITYAEAVEVMTSIDIVDGYADGTFNPAGMLTRGAAAKIICNMVLGPTVAGALPADTAPFPDVPADHVFAGYIAYCQSRGIINGYADGTFKPAGSLTGYAFMKMLLGALGYDALREGYVGDNWSVSVAKQALRLGLDDGLEENFDGTKALNRQEAMLYAFNTLTATMVKYDSPTDVVIGNAVVSAETTAEKVSHTTGYDYRGFREGTSGTMQFCEQYFPQLTATEGRDPMGRPCTTWYQNRAEIGEFADSRNLVIAVQGTLTKEKLRGYIGRDLSDALVNNDPSVSATVYLDGADVTTSTYLKPSALLQKNSSATISTRWITRSSKTYIYVNNDSPVTEVTICIVSPHLYQALGDYDAANESLTVELISANEPAPNDLPTTIEILQEDFNVSGYQEGDYLIVNYSHDTDEVQSIAKARSVSGAVTGYRVDVSVELDGTQYYWNGHERVGTNGNYHATTSTLKTWQEGFSNGNNATLILDDRGYAMWVDALDSDGTDAKYMYVDAFVTTGLVNNKCAAVGYLADGTYVEAAITKVVGKDGNTDKDAAIVSDTTNCPAGNWYRYTTSGNSYSLRYLNAAANSTDNRVYTVNRSTVLSGGTLLKPAVSFYPGAASYLANNRTVFVLLDPDGETHVYTGVINIPELTAKATVGDASAPAARLSMILEGTAGKMAQYVFLDYRGMGDNVGVKENVDSETYVMIMQDQKNWRVVSDEEQYAEVAALVNGAEKTIRVLREEGMNSSELKTGVLYKNVVIDENGYYIRGTEVGAEDDEIGFRNRSDTVYGDDDMLDIGGETLVIDSADVYLVVYQSAGSILGDKGAKYELTTGVSAKALARRLNQADNYSYNYYALLSDDFSASPTALYVFVTDDVADAANNSALIQASSGRFYEKTASTTGTNRVQDALLAENANEYCVRVTFNKNAFKAAGQGKWNYDLKITSNEDNSVIVDSRGLAPEKALGNTTTNVVSAGTLFGSILDDAYVVEAPDATYTVEITMHYDASLGYEDIYLKRGDLVITMGT